MKRLWAVLLMLVATTACADYAQLSSSEKQMGETTVTFNQVDGLSGMTYGAAGVKVNKSGAYFVLAAPQVVKGKGCYNAWMTLNGAQVANSNVQYCSSHPPQTSVVVSQGVFCLEKGDFLNIQQSGSGIEAIHPDGEPQIPSIIFTAFRVGKC